MNKRAASPLKEHKLSVAMLYDSVLELLIDDDDAELERLSKLLPFIAIEGLKDITKVPLIDLHFT